MATILSVKIALVLLMCSTFGCCQGSKAVRRDARASNSVQIETKINVDQFARTSIDCNLKSNFNAKKRGAKSHTEILNINPKIIFSEMDKKIAITRKNANEIRVGSFNKTTPLFPHASLHPATNTFSNDNNTEYLYPPIISRLSQLRGSHFSSEDLVSDSPSSSLTNGNPSHQDDYLANPRSGSIHTGQSSWRSFSGHRWRPRRAIGLARQGNWRTSGHEDESGRLSARRESGRHFQEQRKYDKTSFAGNERNPCDVNLNRTCAYNNEKRFGYTRDLLRKIGQSSSLKYRRERKREVVPSFKLEMSNEGLRSIKMPNSEVLLITKTETIIGDLSSFLTNLTFLEDSAISNSSQKHSSAELLSSLNSTAGVQIQSRAPEHRHQAETNSSSNSSLLLDREHVPFFDHQGRQFSGQRLRQKRATVPDAAIRDDTTKLGNTVGLKGNNSSLKESKIAAIFRGVAYGTPTDSPSLRNDETKASRKELTQFDFKDSKQSANAITQAEIIEKMMRGVKKAIIGKEVRNGASNKESSASYRPEMLKNDPTVVKESVVLSLNGAEMMQVIKTDSEHETRDGRAKDSHSKTMEENQSADINTYPKHETQLEVDNNYSDMNSTRETAHGIISSTLRPPMDIWLEEIDARDVTILSHEGTNSSRTLESAAVRKSLGKYLDLLVCFSSVNFAVLVLMALCELIRGRLWHEVSPVWFALFYISIIASSSLRGSCYLYDSYGTKDGIMEDLSLLVWNLSTSLMLFAIAIFHVILHKTLKSSSNFLSPILVLTLFTSNIFLRVGVDLSPMVFSAQWTRIKSLKYFQFMPISMSLLLILLYLRLLIILERHETGVLKKSDSFPPPPPRLVKSGRISWISVLCQTVLTASQVLNLLFPFKLGEGMTVTLVRMWFAGQIVERVAEIVLLLSLLLASCSLVQNKQGDCPPSSRTNICSLFTKCCAKTSGVHPESRKRSPLKIFTLQNKRSSYDYVTNDFQLVWNQSRIGERSTENMSSFRGVTRVRPDPSNLPPMKFLPSYKRGSESMLTPSPDENFHSPLSKSTTGLYDNIQIGQIITHESKMMSYDPHRGFYVNNYRYLGSTLPHKLNQRHRAHEKFPIDKTLAESNSRLPNLSSSYWTPHSPSNQMQQLRCYRDQYDQSVDSRPKVFQQTNLFARGEEQYFPVERNSQERDHKNWTLEKGERLTKIGHSRSMKEKTVQRTKSHNHKHEHDEEQSQQQQQPWLQGSRIMEGNYVRGRESSSACRSLDHLPALALTHQPESLPIQREAVHFSKTNAKQFAEAPEGARRQLVFEAKISRGFFSNERSRNDRLTMACTARFTNSSDSNEPSLKAANFPPDTFMNSEEENVKVSVENNKQPLNFPPRAPQSGAAFYSKQRSRRTSQKSPKPTSTFYVNH